MGVVLHENHVCAESHIQHNANQRLQHLQGWVSLVEMTESERYK